MTSQSTTQALPLPARPARSTGWAAIAGRVRLAVQLLVSRQALLEMDHRMLKDLGITHAEAVAEARRAPWDMAPPARGPRGNGKTSPRSAK